MDSTPELDAGAEAPEPLDGFKTAVRLEFERSDALRRPCRHGAACYNLDPEHLRKFAHVGEPDYPLAMRVHRPTSEPEFKTLLGCFQFADPYDLGYIDAKEHLAELLGSLKKPEPSQDQVD